MTDPQDQPEEDGYDLVLPFVACTSQGGPFDDEAFVAGFQAGQVYAKLKAAHAASATEVVVCVNSQLVRQLELAAMESGFPFMAEEPWDEAPEWTYLTFRTTAKSA